MVSYAAYGQSGPLAFPNTVGASGTQPFASTFDRRLVNNITFQPTSGTMTVTGIWLPGDMTVNGITFVSGATAESGGTNLWFALYSHNLNSGTSTLMSQSANNTNATAFGANTAFRQALTTPQRLTYSGLYYLAFMCSQGAGAVPALYNITNTGINANGSITGMTPIIAATADAALTTTAPTTMGTKTTITQALYAFVD